MIKVILAILEGNSSKAYTHMDHIKWIYYKRTTGQLFKLYYAIIKFFKKK